MGFAIENMVNINLTKEEMNVVRNGLTLVLALNQSKQIKLNASSEKWYRNVLSIFETVYEDKWA